jgi:hypothetical protein
MRVRITLPILPLSLLALVTFDRTRAVAFAATDGESPPQTRGPRAEGRPKPLPTFSLTFSPLHLLLPVVELTGELRVHDKVGVALVVGAGKISDTVSNVKLTASVVEVGAQLRGYVVGDFRHGMQLGAEVLYLHLSTTDVSARGAGVAVGPFLGYKYVAPIGFTVDVQLGVEYVAARATATDGSQSASNSNSTVIPLLNANVGWSF